MIKRSAKTSACPGRSRIATALLCGALAVAGCGDSTLPLPVEGAPEEMVFSSSGYGMGSMLLELNGSTVTVRRVPWAENGPPAVETTQVVPTAEAWARFWNAADEAGVGRWRRSYRAEHIADGVGWGLRIVSDGTVIQSGGSNAFPDRDGDEHEGEMTDEFTAFLDALGELIGEPL